MYSPILRNRQSEILAIKRLSNKTCKNLMPVLDIASPAKEKDLAAGQKYVERNIDRIKTLEKEFTAIFIDSSELDPDFRLSNNVHPLVSAANAVVDGGSTPIPVTGLHRDAAHNKAVFDIRKKQQGRLCIRLDMTDIGTATLTHKAIQNLLSEDSISPSKTYLLIDLQCLYGSDKDSVLLQLNRLLKLIGKKSWAGVIVGGYAIPDQLSMAVSTNDQCYLRRIEQDIFFNVAKAGKISPLWFSDYTILSPAVVELDFRLIQKRMAPKAIYTLDDYWFVVRGGAFSRHPDGYGQYHSIAEEIVALDDCWEEDDSYGDQYIWECSRRTGKSGSPASWITACVNHHITFTADAHSK